MGINDPIRYNWTFGWDPDGFTEPRPVVNRLLKALIEHDYVAMDALYESGSRLGKCDEDTLVCVLYHVIGDSRTVKWLLSHGLYSSRNIKHEEDGLCTDHCCNPNGYQWGLLPRAWAFHSYESMEMLAEAGFKNLDFCVNESESYRLLDQICSRGDLRAMQLLREYGLDLRPWAVGFYSFGYYEGLKNRYGDSSVVQYVESHPLVTRKGFGLDGALFSIIAKPELRKPRLFHRKEDERWNQLEIANYKDRVRAQRAFAAKYSLTGRINSRAEQEAEDREGELLIQAMQEANSRWKQAK